MSSEARQVARDVLVGAGDEAGAMAVEHADELLEVAIGVAMVAAGRELWRRQSAEQKIMSTWRVSSVEPVAPLHLDHDTMHFAVGDTITCALGPGSTWSARVTRGHNDNV